MLYLDEILFTEKILRWNIVLFNEDAGSRNNFWQSVEALWDNKVIQRLSENQLKILMKRIGEVDSGVLLSQVTYLLEKIQDEYPDKALVINEIIKIKTINGYNEIQKYISESFSIHDGTTKNALPDTLTDFCFSTYSDYTTSNIKAERIIENYSVLTDDQAYLLIVSFFGLQYVKKTYRQKLALLIKTSERYSDARLSELPLYELEALENLL